MKVLERRTSWEGSTSEGTNSHNNTMEESDFDDADLASDEPQTQKQLFDAKEFLNQQIILQGVENEEADKM